MKKIIFILLFIPIITFAQIEKNSISLNILGTSSVLGATYERFITQKLQVEFGIGLIGIGFGVNYYINKIKKNKLNTYIGLKTTSIVLVDVGGGTLLYIPIGINFMKYQNINISLDLGPAYSKWVSSDFGEFTSTTNYRFLIYGNLKLGFRF